MFAFGERLRHGAIVLLARVAELTDKGAATGPHKPRPNQSMKLLIAGDCRPSAAGHVPLAHARSAK